MSKAAIRLGLCCMFRVQPIKFVTTTATAIGKMKRPDALVKLSRLCIFPKGWRRKTITVEVEAKATH